MATKVTIKEDDSRVSFRDSEKMWSNSIEFSVVKALGWWTRWSLTGENCNFHGRQNITTGCPHTDTIRTRARTPFLCRHVNNHFHRRATHKKKRFGILGPWKQSRILRFLVPNLSEAVVFEVVGPGTPPILVMWWVDEFILPHTGISETPWNSVHFDREGSSRSRVGIAK